MTRKEGGPSLLHGAEHFFERRLTIWTLTRSHIIKRFDTDAVSASSLFRAAFPTATAEEEATEMRWIAVGARGIYGDTVAAGLEHLESRKLSGTW